MLLSRHLVPALPVGCAILIAACGGGTGPDGDLPTPSVACVSQPVTQLAAGAHGIIDPASAAGCLRLPAAGASGATYLLVLASTNGAKSTPGIQGSYLLRSSNPLVALSAAVPSVSRAAESPLAGDAAAAFERALRRREAELAADPGTHPLTAPPPPGLVAAPPLGDVRTFKSCGNLTCTSVVNVTATARYVGQHVAIYLDNDVPTNDPLQPADFDNLGHAFDAFHYPIDTTAFGRESDIDGNGVVLILMTDAVNNLTADCTNGRVIGYFFGGDLLTGPNSNRAEIFFTLVPEPARPTECKVVTRSAAVSNLKPTLIHEFQHMISFNQHVLVRNGTAEETWLNEALSHYAEELGGRLIPDAECITSTIPSCRSLYTSGDITNAYEYLRDPEASFLFFSPSGQGTLPERGAGWLFLRWVLDHFAPDPPVATTTTRALVTTNLTGANNVVAVTGGTIAEMVPRNLMAAYLDDGPDLPAEPSGLLNYTSWGLRAIWTNPQNATLFPNGFPVVPLSITGAFSKSGTLKAGSGRHFLITQAANGPAVDLQVLKSTSGAQLDPTLQARFGIVRIR